MCLPARGAFTGSTGNSVQSRSRNSPVHSPDSLLDSRNSLLHSRNSCYGSIGTGKGGGHTARAGLARGRSRGRRGGARGVAVPGLLRRRHSTAPGTIVMVKVFMGHPLLVVPVPKQARHPGAGGEVITDGDGRGARKG